MTKQTAIKLAVRDNNYKWPSQLSNGVMFYYGFKITIDEFNKWAKKFS